MLPLLGKCLWVTSRLKCLFLLPKIHYTHFAMPAASPPLANTVVIPPDLSSSEWHALASLVLELLSSQKSNAHGGGKAQNGSSVHDPTIQSLPWSRASRAPSTSGLPEDPQAPYTKARFIRQLGPIVMERRLSTLLELTGKMIESATVYATARQAARAAAPSVGGANDGLGGLLPGIELSPTQPDSSPEGSQRLGGTLSSLAGFPSASHLSATHLRSAEANVSESHSLGDLLGHHLLASISDSPALAAPQNVLSRSVTAAYPATRAASKAAGMGVVSCTTAAADSQHLAHTAHTPSPLFCRQHVATSVLHLVVWSPALVTLLTIHRDVAAPSLLSMMPLVPLVAPLLPTLSPPLGGRPSSSDHQEPIRAVIRPTLQDTLKMQSALAMGDRSEIVISRGNISFGTTLDGTLGFLPPPGASPRQRDHAPSSLHRPDGANDVTPPTFQFNKASPSSGDHLIPAIKSPSRRSPSPSKRSAPRALSDALKDAEEELFNAATQRGRERYQNNQSPLLQRRRGSPPSTKGDSPLQSSLGAYLPNQRRSFLAHGSSPLGGADSAHELSLIRPSTASDGISLKAASAFLQHYLLLYILSLVEVAEGRSGDARQEQLPLIMAEVMESIANTPPAALSVGGRLTPGMVALEHGDRILQALWRTRREAIRVREEAVEAGTGFWGARRLSTRERSVSHHMTPSDGPRHVGFDSTSAAMSEQAKIDELLDALGSSVLSFQLQVEGMLSQFYDVCIREGRHRRLFTAEVHGVEAPPPTYGAFMATVVDAVAEELRMRRLFPVPGEEEESNDLGQRVSNKGATPKSKGAVPDVSEMVDVHPVPEAAVSYVAAPCVLSTFIEGQASGTTAWEIQQPKALCAVPASRHLMATLHRFTAQNFSEQRSNVSNSVVYSSEVAEAVGNESPGAMGATAARVSAAGGGRSFVLHLRTAQVLDDVLDSKGLTIASAGVITFRLTLQLSPPSDPSSPQPAFREGASSHPIGLVLSRLNGVLCVATQDCLYFYNVLKEPRGEAIKRLLAGDGEVSSSSPKSKRKGSAIDASSSELQCIAVLPVDAPRSLPCSAAPSATISALLLREDMLSPHSMRTTPDGAGMPAGGREVGEEAGTRPINEAVPGHLVRSSGWINNVCILVGGSGGQLSVVRPPVWHAAKGEWTMPCFFSSTCLGEAAQLSNSQTPLVEETVVSMRPMGRGERQASSIVFVLTTRGNVYAVGLMDGSPCAVGIVGSYTPKPTAFAHPMDASASTAPARETPLAVKAVLSCARFGMQHVNDICANEASDYVVCVGSAPFLLVWVAPGRQRRARMRGDGGPSLLVVDPQRVEDIHSPHYPLVTRVTSVGLLEGVVTLDAIGTVKWWNLRSLSCVWTMRVGELNAIPSNNVIKAGRGVAGALVGTGTNKPRAQAKNAFLVPEGVGAALSAATALGGGGEGRRDPTETSPLTNALCFVCSPTRLMVTTQRCLLSFLVRGGHLEQQGEGGSGAGSPSLPLRLVVPRSPRSLLVSSTPTLLSTHLDSGEVGVLSGISSSFPRGVLLSWRSRQRLLDAPAVGLLFEEDGVGGSEGRAPMAVLGRFVSGAVYDLHVTSHPQPSQQLIGAFPKDGLSHQPPKRRFHLPSVEFRPERGGSDTTTSNSGIRAGEGGSVGVVAQPVRNAMSTAPTTIIDWVHTGSYFALLMVSGDVRVHAAVGGSEGAESGSLLFVFSHEDLVAAACQSCAVVGMSTVQDTFLSDGHAAKQSDLGDLHDLDEVGRAIYYCPLWNRLIILTKGSWVWFLPLSLVERSLWGAVAESKLLNEDERRAQLLHSSSEDEGDTLKRLSKSKGEERRERIMRLNAEHRDHLTELQERLDVDGWGDDEDIARSMTALTGFSNVDADDTQLGDGGDRQLISFAQGGGYQPQHKRGWRARRAKRLKAEERKMDDLNGAPMPPTNATPYEAGVPRINVIRGGGFNLFGPFLPDEVGAARLQGTLTFPSFCFFHAGSDEGEVVVHGVTSPSPSPHEPLQPIAASGNALLTNRRSTSPKSSSSFVGGLDFALPADQVVRPHISERRVACSSAFTAAPYIMSRDDGASATTTTTAANVMSTPRYFIGAADGAVEVFVLQGATISTSGPRKGRASPKPHSHNRQGPTFPASTQRIEDATNDGSGSQMDCQSVLSGGSASHSFVRPTPRRNLTPAVGGGSMGPSGSRLAPFLSLTSHRSELIPRRKVSGGEGAQRRLPRGLSVASFGAPMLESRADSGVFPRGSSISQISGGSGAVGGGGYHHQQAARGPHVPISLFVLGRPAILQHVQRIVVSTIPETILPTMPSSVSPLRGFWAPPSTVAKAIDDVEGDFKRLLASVSLAPQHAVADSQATEGKQSQPNSTGHTKEKRVLAEATEMCVNARCKRLLCAPPSESLYDFDSEPQRPTSFVTCITYADPFVVVCCFDGSIRAYLARPVTATSTTIGKAFSAMSSTNLVPSASRFTSGDDPVPSDVRTTLCFTFTAQDLYPMHLEAEMDRCRRAMDTLRRARCAFLARESPAATLPSHSGVGVLSNEEADGVPEGDRIGIEEGYREVMRGLVGSGLLGPHQQRDYGGMALWRQASIRLQKRYEVWQRNQRSNRSRADLPHYITSATTVRRPQQTTVLNVQSSPSQLPRDDATVGGGSVILALGDCWGFVSLVALRVPGGTSIAEAPLYPSSPRTNTHKSNALPHLTAVLDSHLHRSVLGPVAMGRLSQRGTPAARGGVVFLDRWLAHPVVEEQCRPLTRFDEKANIALLPSINPFLYFSDRAHVVQENVGVEKSSPAPVAALPKRGLSRFEGADGVAVERKVALLQGWLHEAQGRWLACEHLSSSLTDIVGTCLFGGPSAAASRYTGDLQPKAHVENFLRIHYDAVRGLPVWCGGSCRNPVRAAKDLMGVAAARPIAGTDVAVVDSERMRHQVMQATLTALKSLGVVSKTTLATTVVSRQDAASVSSFKFSDSKEATTSSATEPQEDEDVEPEESALQLPPPSHAVGSQTTPPTLVAGVVAPESNQTCAFAPPTLPFLSELSADWEELTSPGGSQPPTSTPSKERSTSVTATRWLNLYERRLGVLAVVAKEDSLVTSGCRGSGGTEPVAVWSLSGFFKGSLWSAGRLGSRQLEGFVDEGGGDLATAMRIHLGLIYRAISARHKSWSATIHKYAGPAASLRTMKRRAVRMGEEAAKAPPSGSGGARPPTTGFDPDRQFAQADLPLLFERTFDDDVPAVSDAAATLSNDRASAHQAALRDELGYVLQETMSACTQIMLLSSKGGLGRFGEEAVDGPLPVGIDDTQFGQHFTVSPPHPKQASLGGWVPPSSTLSASMIGAVATLPPGWFVCDPFGASVQRCPLLYFGACLDSGKQTSLGSNGFADWGWDGPLRSAAVSPETDVSSSVLCSVSSLFVLQLPHHRNNSTLLLKEAASVRAATLEACSWLYKDYAAPPPALEAESLEGSLRGRAPPRPSPDTDGLAESNEAGVFRQLATRAIFSVPTLMWTVAETMRTVTERCLIPVLGCASAEAHPASGLAHLFNLHQHHPTTTPTSKAMLRRPSVQVSECPSPATNTFRSPAMVGLKLSGTLTSPNTASSLRLPGYENGVASLNVEPFNRPTPQSGTLSPLSPLPPLPHSSSSDADPLDVTLLHLDQHAVSNLAHTPRRGPPPQQPPTLPPPLWTSNGPPPDVRAFVEEALDEGGEHFTFDADCWKKSPR